MLMEYTHSNPSMDQWEVFSLLPPTSPSSLSQDTAITTTTFSRKRPRSLTTTTTTTLDCDAEALYQSPTSIMEELVVADLQDDLQDELERLEAENQSLEERLECLKAILLDKLHPELAARVCDPYEDFARKLCGERARLVQNLIESFNKGNPQIKQTLFRSIDINMEVLHPKFPIGKACAPFMQFLLDLRKKYPHGQFELVALESEECHGLHMTLEFQFIKDTSLPLTQQTMVPGRIFITFNRSWSKPLILRQLWYLEKEISCNLTGERGKGEGEEGTPQKQE